MYNFLANIIFDFSFIVTVSVFINLAVHLFWSEYYYKLIICVKSIT